MKRAQKAMLYNLVPRDISTILIFVQKQLVHSPWRKETLRFQVSEDLDNHWRIARALRWLDRDHQEASISHLHCIVQCNLGPHQLTNLVIDIEQIFSDFYNRSVSLLLYCRVANWESHGCCRSSGGESQKGFSIEHRYVLALHLWCWLPQQRCTRALDNHVI